MRARKIEKKKGAGVKSTSEDEELSIPLSSAVGLLSRDAVDLLKPYELVHQFITEGSAC